MAPMVCSAAALNSGDMELNSADSSLSLSEVDVSSFALVSFALDDEIMWRVYGELGATWLLLLTKEALGLTNAFTWLLIDMTASIALMAFVLNFILSLF